MPFGLASAPEVYQQLMNDILKDIPNVECSMDDILIFASTMEHLKELTAQVLRRLQAAGLKLNKEKCKFFVDEVKFLGHILTSQGLLPDPDKVAAISNLKKPTNRTELMRFLGMATYLSKFIPHLSHLTEPLRRLLVKYAAWEWTQEQDHAVTTLKETLLSPPVLAYYDVNQDVTLSVDASSTALGAVLLQAGHPVAYATKSLTQTQIRYPQIEKEALAIQFGCKKFHDYVYGKKLVVETDHKPLEAISKKCLQQAPPRLQRIFFDVLQYSPQIVYKKGKDIPLADALSRDCHPVSPDFLEEEMEVHLIVPLSDSALEELRQQTLADQELQVLANTTMQGWPEDQSQVHPLIKPYWTFRDEIAVYEDVLLKGERLIVPKTLHNKYLHLIHEGHLGVQSSLRRARDSVFWKGITNEIIEYVQRCSVCQRTQRDPPKAELLMKPVPERPWQIVGTDIFHFAGKNYVLIADSYSGFFDFSLLSSLTSAAVIAALKIWFSVHGAPETLESDNGPQYSSLDFRHFVEQWHIHHATSSPHFPRSNGLAERNVQIAKGLLRKCALDGSDIYLALLNIRNTPRTEALGSPAQRLFSRRTRTVLPCTSSSLQPKVVPAVSTSLTACRDKQKECADGPAPSRSSFERGDNVLLRETHRQWTPATIFKETPYPRSYMVHTPDGAIIRRNTSFLRPSLSPERVVVPSSPPVSPSKETETNYSPSLTANPSSPLRTSPTTPVLRTRSGRVVKPPDRLVL